MKILLLGKGGQVGWELQRSLSLLGEVVACDFDSPGEIEAIEQLLDKESKRWKRVPFETECAVVTMRLQGIRSHVGFILPNDRFIHASEEVGVGIDRLSLPPFDRAKIGAYVYE